VTGHIDGTGRVERLEDEDGSTRMIVSAPPAICSMIMEKGLVAVDGISLTPAEVREDTFTLYLIPDTLRKTTISEKKRGDILNIELDLFGKYIEKYVMKYMDALAGRKNGPARGRRQQ
jgi:riboflavin synthase